MIEILEAFRARAISTPTLMAGLNGMFLLRAKQGTNPPYGVLTPISAVPEYNTSTTYIQPVQIQLSLFCRDVFGIKTLIKAYRDNYNRKTLTLATGKVMQAMLTNERLFEDSTEENEALRANNYVLEWEFTQIQSHT